MVRFTKPEILDKDTNYRMVGVYKGEHLVGMIYKKGKISRMSGLTSSLTPREVRLIADRMESL